MTTRHTLTDVTILGMFGIFSTQLYINVRFMRTGVKHSVLKQMGEGLLSSRSGAGAPAAKAVYRGGKARV